MARYLAQIWFLPVVGVDADLSSVLNSDAACLRRVLIDVGSGQHVLVSLIQKAFQDADDIGCVDLDAAFVDMNRFLIKFAFCLLTPLNVVAARVLPAEVKTGELVKQVAFPGAPPVMSLYEAYLGFNRTMRDPMSLKDAAVPQHVEAAITWFLQGLLAPNAVYKFLHHWIALEMLAPSVSGPWHCSRCNKDIVRCPRCGEATNAPRSFASIRSYLCSRLGVDKKLCRTLYDVRCKLTHGSVPLDATSIQVVSQQSLLLQDIVLRAIKTELGIPVDDLPTIAPEGVSLLGTPGFVLESKVESEEFLTQPPIIGFWQPEELPGAG